MASRAIAVVMLLHAIGSVALATSTDLIVFVTNETFVSGGQPGLLNGVTESDQKCQDRAQLAGLPGTYKAWLSDDSSSAADRQGHSLTRWVLVDGTTVVASDWTDLTNGTLQHAIDQDEYGNPTSGAAVWTGTAADGTASLGSDNCGAWFSSVGTGRQGTTSGTDATWTSSADSDCSTAAHLYCFQQCPDVDTDGQCDAPPTTTTTSTTLPPPGQFQFMTGDLSDGDRYADYFDALEFANGTPPYNCTVDAGTVTVDGTAYPNLAAIGLMLNKTDGTLVGIPLVSGAVAFQTTCTDAGGRTARSADGSTTHQAISFDLAGDGGVQLSSAVVITSLTIKSGYGSGKDSLSCKGVVNLDAAPSSLSGAALSFHVLGYSAPVVTFDGKATAATGRGVKPAVKASVKKNGIFGITTSKETISLDGTSGNTADVVVELRIGDVVQGVQVVRCAVKTSKTGRTLTYKGDGANDLGGSFMVVGVTGADDKAGTGDAWKTTVAARAPAGVSLSSVSSATISVGSNTRQLPLSAKGTRLSGKATDRFSFSLDTKRGNCSFTTPVLTSASSGIPRAGTAATAAVKTTIVLNGPSGTPVLTGESTKTVSSKKTKWSSN